MSIKGDCQELYVGKTEANLFTLTGKRINIPYHSITKIDYMLSKSGEIGYFEFKTNERKSYRFDFGKKVNNQISRAVDLIQEALPELVIEEHQVADMEFYKRNWFIVLMLIFIMPVGIFLMWYYKKYSTPIRVTFTIGLITLWILGICIAYMNYLLALQSFNNAVNQIYRSVY